MKYGLILGSASIQGQIDTAIKAEQAGFESVWGTEFFNANGLVRLAAVASQTSSIQIGSAIAYAFMRTPMLAATGAMDIDEISGGRFILGLGTGTKRMNEDWYSMPFDAPPAPRVKEAIALIRAAFAAGNGGGLKFEGKYYNINIPAYVRRGTARETIPICLAAVNKGMISAAAAIADGLICHPIFTRTYIRERVMPKLEGTACKAYPYIITSIADSTEQARNEVRGQIGFYYTTRLYHSVLEPNGWQAAGEKIASAFRAQDFKAMAEAVTDEMIDEIAIAGTADEVRDQVTQWHDVSDHSILYTPSIGMPSARVQENLDAIIETFAK
ncbi:MAG TPA: LLM class flavin-dependent oxidoreductase [Pseudomonadales bacterium]|nr:LLM class flavin-dependent oxidoreductase [Pseudomonadales bacterium]